MLTPPSDSSSLLKRRHFDPSIIILCVRWYIAYKLSYQWKYLYRAVDKQGNTVDFLLSEHRDIAAAKWFFIRAIDKHSAPEKVTLDGYAATHTAIGEMQEEALLPQNLIIRTSKYLNNLIEQDHRRVKQRVYPMLGFKRFENAAVTISGVELAHKIRKGQFDTSAIKQDGVREPEVWEAVLAAKQ